MSDATLSDSFICHPDEGGTDDTLCFTLLSHTCPAQGGTPPPDIVLTDSSMAAASATACQTRFKGLLRV